MIKKDTTTVVACSLNDEEFKARRALARDTLLKNVLRSRRIVNGLIVTFKDDHAVRAEIKQFIALERQCCGFLDFVVSEAPLNQLTISGPPEASSTIDIFAATIEGATNGKTSL